MVNFENMPKLNNDVLFYLLDNHSSNLSKFLIVNKQTRAIALTYFSQAVLKIMEAFPLEMTELDKTNRTDDNAHKIFMRIINRLHDEAKYLNCDQSYSAYLDQATLAPSNQIDQLEWESTYYLDLMKKIEEQTKIYKEEAFHTFVKKVAANIGLLIPDGINMRNFWDQHLKDNEQLKQMIQLDLTDCQMKFLPPEIGLFPNLEELNLNLNQLRELPPELGNLSKLKHLDLNSNQIKELPSQLSSLSNLISLNISFNQFSHFPKVLGTLSNLRHLQMMNNNLKELSPVIQLLSDLESLNLSSNPLGNFPEEITSLKNLTSLHLNRVKLKEIPSQLADLKELKILSLGANQLREIDLQLIDALPQLEHLFLRNNPLNEEIKLRLKDRNISFKRRIELDGFNLF